MTKYSPVICRTAYPVIPLLRRVLLKHPQNHASGRCSHNHRSQIHKGTSNGGKDKDTSMRRPEGTAKCHGKPSCNRRTYDTGRNHAQRILAAKGMAPSVIKDRPII